MKKFDITRIGPSACAYGAAEGGETTSSLDSIVGSGSSGIVSQPRCPMSASSSSVSE
jgi:hypothetical protein